MGKKDVRTVSEFDQLVNNNKASDKHWHHGLKDKQLRRMSESDARRYFVKLEEEEKALVDKIVLASTWNINCGIATYTRYLLDSLDRIIPNSFTVNPLNEGILKYKSMGRLTHLQHEFGIVPEPPKIKSKLIITWHTVSKHTNDTIKEYESNYDVVAHIVHSEYIRPGIDSSKDVWGMPHGSMLIPEMKKEEARRLLGINIDMPIGFVFGFQSGDKNYGRLIDAAKNTGVHIIISGAPHNVASSIYIENDKNVTVINSCCFFTNEFATDCACGKLADSKHAVDIANRWSEHINTGGCDKFFCLIRVSKTSTLYHNTFWQSVENLRRCADISKLPLYKNIGVLIFSICTRL